MQRPGSSLASTFNRVSISSDATYTPNLDAAVDSAFRRAQLYEAQIRQLEQTLTGDLHTSNEVDAELTRVQHGLHASQRRAKTALTATVPHILHSLSDDMDTLTELDKQLPVVGEQVNHIRDVYSLGRQKAQQLSDSLDWLNTPVPSRLWTILFTPNAPVNQRWKTIIFVIMALNDRLCGEEE